MWYILSLLSNSYLSRFYQIVHRASLVLLGYSYALNQEKNLIRHLAKFYQKNDSFVFFDVGLNVGEYSRSVFEQFGAKAQIHGFEPIRGTYTIAMKNLEEVAGNWNNFGLGKDQSEAIIHYDWEGQGTASIHDVGEKKLEEKIQIEKLDTYVGEKNITNINFLKVDVEGYELNVLLGAQEVIKKKGVEIIQFEFSKSNIHSRVFFYDFWNLLSNDYRIYRILGNSLFEIKKYHSADCEIFLGMNYLAVRNDIGFRY